MMENSFLFTMAPDKYDLLTEFKEKDYVDWILNICKNAKSGDMVYIYVTSPYSGIKFSAEIEKIKTEDNILVARLINFKQVIKDFESKLKLAYFIENGYLKMAPRGKQGIYNPEFIKFLNSNIFEKIDNSEHKEVFLESDMQLSLNQKNKTDYENKQFQYSQKKNEKPKIIEKNGYKYTERNNKEIILALDIAKRKCEFDENHLSFWKENGERYVEAHHLIPFCKWDDFNAGLDVAENIICLCSECHNKLHYGQNSVKREMIEKFFNIRKSLLRSKDLEIELDKLLKYYKIKNI